MFFKLMSKIFPDEPEFEYEAELKSDATPQEIFEVSYRFCAKYYQDIVDKCISIEEYNTLPKNVQRHFVKVPNSRLADK